MWSEPLLNALRQHPNSWRIRKAKPERGHPRKCPAGAGVCAHLASSGAAIGAPFPHNLWDKHACPILGKDIQNQAISWRSRRDSNPRYVFTTYNGLANRRLQPLGHSSIQNRRGLVPAPDRGRHSCPSLAGASSPEAASPLDSAAAAGAAFQGRRKARSATTAIARRPYRRADARCWHIAAPASEAPLRPLETIRRIACPPRAGKEVSVAHFARRRNGPRLEEGLRVPFVCALCCACFRVGLRLRGTGCGAWRRGRAIFSGNDLDRRSLRGR